MAQEPPIVSFKVGGYISIGGRPYQEDRLVSFRNFNTVIPGITDVQSQTQRSFFACFDGHGGSIVSEYLSNRFHHELAAHSKLLLQPMAALQGTWAGMDEKCLQECQKMKREKGLQDLPRDGSTATVCFIVRDDIYLTNCGDSAAHVILQNGSTLLLTEEHGTHNVSEAQRIQAAGGHLKPQFVIMDRPFPFCCFRVRKNVGKPRVYPGGLLVTRAFGDFHAKLETLGGQRGVVVPDHGRVQYLKLSKETGPKFIIVASDGLWDALGIDEVATLIKQFQEGEALKRQSNAVAPEGAVTKPDKAAVKKPGLVCDSLDHLHSRLAEYLCTAAIQSRYWNSIGCPPDNTSCTIIEVVYS